MPKVKSKDGTLIAFDQSGQGPALILVCGALCTRMNVAPHAELLSEFFTVFNYDRRGRGESGDEQPYAVQREVEDIDALIDAAGGPVCLFGGSSGAALALDAAYGLKARIAKLAMYEPPYFVEGYPRPPTGTAEVFTNLVAAGKRGEAVEFFLSKVVGFPAEFLVAARKEPWWAGQEAMAHTLAYDAAIMGDYSLPREKTAAINIPALVMVGGASPPFMHASAEAIAKILPNGQFRTLEGQQHDVAPKVLAPVLKEFFNAT